MDFLQITKIRKAFRKLSIDKSLNKTQLRDSSGITSATLARLSKNKGVSLEALERICRALECEIGDIVKFTEEKEIIKE